MLPKDLFQKVRRIEITTNRLVTDIFAGQYHSVFKGQGIEFEEVREYQFGDDIRTIDWNVTARTGRPHIKKFVEERELTVMIMVDASRSCQFASVNELKSKLAAEIAAVLAISAIRNNDKVGLMIFTDQVEKFIPPRKGMRHVLRVIREALYFKPEHTLTNLKTALDHVSRILRRKAVVFVISDFFGEAPVKNALAIANKRHDVIAITLNDPSEIELPNCGLIQLEDAETGKEILVDSSDEMMRRRYAGQAAERIKLRERLFRSAGIDHIDVATHIPYTEAMVKFFLQRRRRFR